LYRALVHLFSKHDHKNRVLRAVQKCFVPMSSVCPPSNGDCACFSAAGCAGDELAAFVQLGPVVKGTARGWGPVVVSVSVVVGVK